MTTTTFTVYGTAATKGSSIAFAGRHGVVVKPDCENLAAWSQACGWAARAANVPLAPAGTAIAIDAVFTFVRPKSYPDRAWPHVRPDIDKLARALLDALTHVAYVDDAQVVSLVIKKVYGPQPLMTVSVSEMVE